MLLGHLMESIEIVVTAILESLAPHVLCQFERLRAGRIEQPRGRFHLSQDFHDEIKRTRHVPSDVMVGEVPSTALPGNLEGALPGGLLGQVDHPTEQAAVGADGEDRGGDDAIEQVVCPVVVKLDDLLGFRRVGIAEVWSSWMISLACAA